MNVDIVNPHSRKAGLPGVALKLVLLDRSGKRIKAAGIHDLASVPFGLRWKNGFGFTNLAPISLGVAKEALGEVAALGLIRRSREPELYIARLAAPAYVGIGDTFLFAPGSLLFEGMWGCRTSK